MRIHAIIKHTVIIAPFVLILGAPWVSAQIADQPLTEVKAPAPAAEPGRVAAGSVEDTLLACMARIPQDASDGQRMMAEESCNREEGTRTLSQIAPKF